ncbi:MAG: hypothetical protein H0U19_11290 [Acidobacteria bacterium]|nr:hypothetical protein [Acidobacteriota bacterium]
MVMVTPNVTSAQEPTVREVLSFLLTNQQVPTGDFVKDQAATAATRDTISRALLVELATLPISTSSGGFTYTFNSTLGTMERVSETFGPLFLDRAVTTGRRQVSFGMAYRHASFRTLDGRDLRDGTLVTTANKFRDEQQPFDVEALTLRLSTSTVTFVGNYGVSSRFDIGAAVPVVALQLDGERTNTYYGTSFVQARGTATATGLADVAIRAKYRMLGAGAQGLAAGVELRLPTGSAEDLRGAGDLAVRVSMIGSVARGPLESHFNVALTEGGVSREVGYAGGVVWAAGSRVTFSGELLARRIEALGGIQNVVEPHPTLRNVDTIRLLASGQNATTRFAGAGAKWNVTRTLLLTANVIVPLSDSGVKSGPVPTVSLDYSFAR